MDIKEALAQLDKANDEHWTADGMPRMDVLQFLIGDDGLTRKDVTNAAPEFTRETAPEPVAEPVVEPEGEDPDAAGAEVAPVDEPVVEPALDKDRDIYDLLKLPMSVIAASEEAMITYRADLDQIMNDWNKKKKEIETDMASLGRLGQRLDRMLKNKKASRPNSDTEDVRAYLASQQKTRREKAERVLDLQKHGIDGKSLAQALNSKSALDTALGQRKAAPGSTRPDPRMPVRGTRQAGG